MPFCPRIQRTIRHGQRLLTSLLLMTWTGCGCVQTPPADTPPSPVASVSITPAPDPHALLALPDVLSNQVRRLRPLATLGSAMWYQQDALRQTQDTFLKTALRACLSADESDSLRLALALYHLDRLRHAPTDEEGDSQKNNAVRSEVDYGLMASNILQRLKTNPAQDAMAQTLPDVLDYYIGMLELSKAETASDDADALTHARLAHDAFSRATQNRRGAFYHLAREGEVKACIAARSTCQATDAIEQFLNTYPDYPGLPDLKLRYAQILLEQENPIKARATLEDLIWHYPWAEAVKQAQRLVAEHAFELRERSFDETLEQIDFLRRKRFWKLAQEQVDAALIRFPDSLQLMMQDARLSYEQSNYAPAIEKFQKLYDALGNETRDNIRPASVVAYIYRAHGYNGNCKEAMRRQEENLTRLGRNDRIRAKLDYALTCGALDEVWKNARILKEQGLLEDWDYGFYAYLAQAYDEARLAFTQALETQTGTYKRRTHYFLAQATYKTALQKAQSPKDVPTPSDDTPSPQKKKKKSRSKSKAKTPVLPEATPALARMLFEQLLRENSSDYYAILASSRLAEMDGEPTLESSPLFMPLAGKAEFDPQSAQSPARPITATYTFDESHLANGDISAWLHAQVERYADIWPQLRRIELLHRAGLYAARNREMRPIMIEANAITKLAKSPTPKNVWYSSLSLDGHLVDNRRTDTGYWGIALDETYFQLPDKKATAAREQLARHQQAIFEDKTAIRQFIRTTAILFHDYYLARRYTGVPASTPGTPKDNDTWSILYPHAYNHAIVEASRRNGVSPYLLWTLMNIESAFNPDSVSVAEAYGLLQIIPITGYKLAEALQYKDFGPYDLIRPERSIPMGAWYFGQIIKKFGGHATLSMAGYNGGPFQVARWITAYGQKMEHDAFVELIPLNEARNYVKKGMARLLIFERIDHADPNYFYYVSNTLPTTFEEMPNF